jgi:hypothetical protein
MRPCYTGSSENWDRCSRSFSLFQVDLSVPEAAGQDQPLADCPVVPGPLFVLKETLGLLEKRGWDQIFNTFIVLCFHCRSRPQFRGDPLAPDSTMSRLGEPGSVRALGSSVPEDAHQTLRWLSRVSVSAPQKTTVVKPHSPLNISKS